MGDERLAEAARLASEVRAGLERIAAGLAGVRARLGGASGASDVPAQDDPTRDMSLPPPSAEIEIQAMMPQDDGGGGEF